MNDREGHRQDGRQQNRGNDSDFTNESRQQNQFAEGGRQAGSNWQDYGQGGYYSSGQMGGAYQGNYQPGGRQQDDRQRPNPRIERNYPNEAYRDQAYPDRGEGRRDGYAPQQRGYSGYSGYSRDYDGASGTRFSNFTSEDYGGRDFSGSGSAASAGFASSESYRPSYGPGSWSRHRDDRSQHNDRGTRDYGDWRSYGESRGFLDRAGDEIASWFGDEDAARRREQDHNHSGRGPANYTRSDERIREDANDSLTRDHRVDARNIDVTVSSGEVTLSGTVDSRQAKRRAEDLVDHVAGVRHVQNNLRVDDAHARGNWDASRSGTDSMGASTTAATSSSSVASASRGTDKSS